MQNDAEKLYFTNQKSSQPAVHLRDRHKQENTDLKNFILNFQKKLARWVLELEQQSSSQKASPWS